MRTLLMILRYGGWPLVALIVLGLYHQDIRSIIHEREIKVGSRGIEIGPQLRQLNENAQTELADIRKMLAQFSDTTAAPNEQAQVAQMLTEQVARLEQRLTQEVNKLQNVPPTAIASPTDLETKPSELAVRHPATRSFAHQEIAAFHEGKGFDALLRKDFTAALDAFKNAQQQAPDYHNVAAIYQLLEQKKSVLTQPHSGQAWLDVYRKLLTDYTWGMSLEYRNQFRQRLVDM